jgi:hypothetical protein
VFIYAYVTRQCGCRSGHAGLGRSKNELVAHGSRCHVHDLTTAAILRVPGIGTTSGTIDKVRGSSWHPKSGCFWRLRGRIYCCLHRAIPHRVISCKPERQALFAVLHSIAVIPGRLGDSDLRFTFARGLRLLTVPRGISNLT